MLKPICVPCQRFFRPKKNGTFFQENKPTSNNAPPGNEYPDAWEPYKIWLGDLWECKGCGANIIVGVGQEPFLEHFEPGFEEAMFNTEAHLIQINDC